MRTLLSCLLFSLACLHGVVLAQPVRTVNDTSLRPAQLAVVINDDDARSVEVGEYYRQVREIPVQNVVHVHIPNQPRKLNAEQFKLLKDQIDARLGPQIQAVLMVWTAPYAVECNSITAAYTLGLDLALCQKPCAPSKPSAYFNAVAGTPFTDFGLRISMLLPVESVEGAKALIDRGRMAGFNTPAANAFYLTTSETARNSRVQYFPPTSVVTPKKLNIKNLHADFIENQKDIMFYQTGMARVAKLDTLQFLPGALADHLTSAGGDLLSDYQMSSLRWLDAGATASYGSVTEPCNYWQKFPNSMVLLRQYLAGASAIEAYWKSVAWPAQGVFIGEPLAAPYRH